MFHAMESSFVPRSEDFKAQKPETEKDIEALKEDAETAIKRFSKIKHPLSEQGLEFLERARIVLTEEKPSVKDLRNILENIPTVEEPHLEYFKDVFESVPEEERSKIYFNTSVIQTTKGCSHECLHCALGAESKLQIMPYVTVLKVDRALQEGKEQFLKDYQAEAKEIEDEMHQGIINREKIQTHLMQQVHIGGNIWGAFGIISFCRVAMNGDFLTHAIHKLMRQFEEQIPEIKDVDWKSITQEERKKILQTIVDAYKFEITEKLRQKISSRSPYLSSVKEQLEKEINSSLIRLVDVDNGQVIDTAYRDAVGELFLGNNYDDESWDEGDMRWKALLNDRRKLRVKEIEKVIQQALDSLEKNKDHPFFTGKDKIFFPGGGESLTDLLGPSQIRGYADEFYNYWDSDPFDYRDMNVRDKAGHPADYGDIFKIFQNKYFGIVTAGWIKTDKIAQRAGEKIANLGQDVVISVHFYGKEAQKNPDKYKESLKNVINTLYPNIRLRWFGDDSLRLIKEIFLELGLILKEEHLQAFYETSVYSGRGKENKEILQTMGREIIQKRDIAGCMKGYHIRPNGNIEYKKSNEEGVRPQPTGFTIY